MTGRKTQNIIFWTLLLSWLTVEALAYVLIVTKADQSMDFSVSYLSIIADLVMTAVILVFVSIRAAHRATTGARLRESIFLFLAYVCTATADYFLTITADRYEIAVGVFLGAQIFHFLRISAARHAASKDALVKHPLAGILLSVFARVILSGLVLIVLHVTGLWSLLNALAAVYFVELLMNTMDAALTAAHALRFAVLAAGFLLFICCDVTVGLRALTEVGTISMTPDRFALNTYLTWVFYLPSQVMIILSVLVARKKTAEKAA
ncbi:MAG: hypothetical protein IJU49_01890 [Lachnospiraceae bacterium]|nr:hypothetical protein [Lachnospiraceae bacterium]